MGAQTRGSVELPCPLGQDSCHVAGRPTGGKVDARDVPTASKKQEAQQQRAAAKHYCNVYLERKKAAEYRAQIKLPATCRRRFLASSYATNVIFLRCSQS